MEEEEAKSALELAMERISALPKLTPEEKAEQKEREFGPMGTAMALKYMDGTLTDAELPIELKKYPENRQQIVRRALILSLCREMRPEKGWETALKSLRGILRIAPEKKEFLEKAERSMGQIFSDFEKDKKESYGRFEASAAERIGACGISGSAVRVNLNENEEWSRELIRLAQAYEPRAEKLRDALIEEICSKTPRFEDSK